MGSPHFLLVIKQKQLSMLLSYLNIRTNEDQVCELFLLTYLTILGITVQNIQIRLYKLKLQEVITFKCFHCEKVSNKYGLKTPYPNWTFKQI
jgi:hypothetical protein